MLRKGAYWYESYKKNRLVLYIAIPVIILMILLRFGLYSIRSDGFSGLSMLLPILLLCFILLHCVPADFSPHGYIRIVKGGEMIRYYGRL